MLRTNNHSLISQSSPTRNSRNWPGNAWLKPGASGKEHERVPLAPTTIHLSPLTALTALSLPRRFPLVNTATLRNHANHGATGKKDKDRCDNRAGE
jgi:hypothetical protein